MKWTTYKELSEEKKELVNAAEKVMENAYSPYSGFSVGAAIRTKNGYIITGANVENAAYGSSICAERAALLRANAEGHQDDIREIAIIAYGKDFSTTEISAPCGCCRQMINEAAQISNCDIGIILCAAKKGKIGLTMISELLPFAFGPKDLNLNTKNVQR